MIDHFCDNYEAVEAAQRAGHLDALLGRPAQHVLRIEGITPYGSGYVRGGLARRGLEAKGASHVPRSLEGLSYDARLLAEHEQEGVAQKSEAEILMEYDACGGCPTPYSCGSYPCLHTGGGGHDIEPEPDH